MDRTHARALLAGKRVRLERLLAAEPGGLGAPNVGGEVDDAARREAGETGAAVDELCVTVGLRSSGPRRGWPPAAPAARSAAAGAADERLDADPLAGLTVEEAAAEERGAIEESDGAVGLVSASHQFEVLNDADITPEEQLADEEDEDESAPESTQDLRILRDAQLR
jgi:hypothetical protein